MPTCCASGTTRHVATPVAGARDLARATPLRRHKALALPLMPATWRAPQRSAAYDWALVSSHAFAHHVNVGSPECPKYVYVHTPARYLWAPELDARGDNLAARLAGPPAAGDRPASRAEATSIAANSRFVADRVERAWERPATVIHPPVDVAWIRSGGWRKQLTDADRRVLEALPADFVLGVSRFIPYKRLDAVMQTGQLLGVPVVIAGHGPLEAELRAMAAEFTVPGAVPHPAERRAGVRAHGTSAHCSCSRRSRTSAWSRSRRWPRELPVMANRVGGSGESVQDGLGGRSVRSPVAGRDASGCRSVTTCRPCATRCAIADHMPGGSTRAVQYPRCRAARVGRRSAHRVREVLVTARGLRRHGHRSAHARATVTGVSVTVGL